MRKVQEDFFHLVDAERRMIGPSVRAESMLRKADVVQSLER